MLDEWWVDLWPRIFERCHAVRRNRHFALLASEGDGDSFGGGEARPTALVGHDCVF
jgi:hypothetical protein